MPVGVAETAYPLLAARALRAFGDGYVAVLLPAYLLVLGFDQLDVGFLTTATLAGSALAMLGLGAIGHRWTTRRLLLFAALSLLEWVLLRRWHESAKGDTFANFRESGACH